MRRTIAVLVCAAGGLAGVGCNSLKYTEQTPDGGVIAFKVKDRDAALAKLKRDYGEVEHEAEYDPMANTPGKPFDPSAPVKPSERLVAGGVGSLVGGADDGVMHIKFRKKPTTPAGLPPAPPDDGLVQAGYSRPAVGGPPKRGGSALPPPDMTGMPGH